MNRRTFFAGLVALPAVVKAALNPPDNPYRCVITPNFRGTIVSREFRASDWMRSTGRITCHTPEYEAALDRIFKNNGNLKEYLEGFRK